MLTTQMTDEARPGIPGRRLHRVPERWRRIVVDRQIEARPSYGGQIPIKFRQSTRAATSAGDEKWESNAGVEDFYATKLWPKYTGGSTQDEKCIPQAIFSPCGGRRT